MSYKWYTLHNTENGNLVLLTYPLNRVVGSSYISFSSKFIRYEKMICSIVKKKNFFVKTTVI